MSPLVTMAGVVAEDDRALERRDDALGGVRGSRSSKSESPWRGRPAVPDDGLHVVPTDVRVPVLVILKPLWVSCAAIVRLLAGVEVPVHHRGPEPVGLRQVLVVPGALPGFRVERLVDGLPAARLDREHDLAVVEPLVEVVVGEDGPPKYSTTGYVSCGMLPRPHGRRPVANRMAPSAASRGHGPRRRVLRGPEPRLRLPLPRVQLRRGVRGPRSTRRRSRYSRRRARRRCCPPVVPEAAARSRASSPAMFPRPRGWRH